MDRGASADGVWNMTRKKLAIALCLLLAAVSSPAQQKSADGSMLVHMDSLNRIRCTQTISTATTLTVMPGAAGVGCAAPGANMCIYITDILFATNAAGIAADTFNTLKFGTGGACGTGTTVFWGCFTTAATQATCIQSFNTPIMIPANNEVCWMNSTAGSKFVDIIGYVTNCS